MVHLGARPNPAAYEASYKKNVAIWNRSTCPYATGPPSTKPRNHRHRSELSRLNAEQKRRHRGDCDQTTLVSEAIN
jgi:hypothetical protein